MAGFWISACAITLVLWLLWRLHYTKVRKVIDKFPGPPALPFIGNVHQIGFLSQQEFMVMVEEYAEKYYPIYRTWRLMKPMLHISDPHHAEVFLSNTQNIKKTIDYGFIAEWLGTGLLISSGSKWHSRRKLLTPAFHFSILEQFVPVFSDKTRILIEKLREHVDKPDGVDVVPLVTMCALDIICETAMGVTINAQVDRSSPYTSNLHEINALLMYRMLRPWLYPEWIYKLTSTGRRQKKCLQTLHAFTKKVIQERRQELQSKMRTNKGKPDTQDDGGSKKKVAFLDLLIQVSEEQKVLTDEDIREEVDTFMFEGHDTTSMGMSWALYFIARYPDIQEKCVQELNEIFSGSDRDPTLADLKNMKYLDRVIKETLRLRPSVYTIGRELDHPVEMDGYEIPVGTDIQIDIYNIHHHPKHFPDPEKFDPDRFLPENSVGRHPYAYIPFSAGHRNCIGQKFALLEEKALLSTVLRHFELRALYPDRDKAPIPDLILRPLHGINLKLMTRH